MSLYLNLWFGEFLAFAYNDHKALVNIILRKLVVKTSEVFLQFANSSLIVRQQGQTEGQITPLPFSSTHKHTRKKKSKKQITSRNTWMKRKGKEKKGTLFKCQAYLALRHTNCGHCKLKLIQIKFNQMQVIDQRGKLIINLKG